MKKNETKQERPQALKRKLMSALAMLLVSTILMTTTSYAWFVLSTAPEVTGIETQVGANGSLEIALLNKETRADMSTIRAGLGGGSLQENQITANNAWGNLVDLGFASYGLGELVLMPARLDATATGDSYTVDVNKLLAVPSYGFDGRIIELSRDTASAVYKDTDFMYSGGQEYGVRAIGTSDALSPQGSALASAKTNISSYSGSAKKSAQSALSDNVDGLFSIIMQKTTDENGFTDEHKATLVAMIEDLDLSLEYIDLSLRQGLVAYAASALSNVDTFNLVRDRIMNTATPLTDLMNDLAEIGTIPETFNEWVAQLAEMQNDLALANNACAELTDGSYTWDEIKGIMAKIMNMDMVKINGKTMSEGLDIGTLMGSNEIELLLVPGSGLYADIADFTGNYSVSTKYSGKTVEMVTASVQSPAYLAALSAAVNTLEPADGGDESTATPLDATYGYAIDLAFRCNAANPDLVLQTAGVQRIYNGGENPDDIESDNASTQGGGSYMEFTCFDESFTLEQQLALMDAIRVAFVDDMGNIMAIAKLSVTARDTVDGVVKAPLYLYDYTFEQDDVSDGLILTMGERKLTENLITNLEQNVAKAVTVVVWLDGDIVDNTMVSATQATSLDGVLNLQFATSAELVPAVEGKILEYSPDKTGLEQAVLALEEVYNAGQGTFTNVSWNEFATAFTRAKSVNENANAGHVEVRHAVNNLQMAYLALEEVNTDAVNNKAQEIRELMGMSDETSRYVITDENGNYVTVDGTQSDEEKTSWNVVGTILSVDTATNNRNDEGNGIYTERYSDETWNALANALYQAEAVAMNPNATENEINAALSALEAAEKALTNQVYYAPYEYNGDLYYMAMCEQDAVDTYGRWYDSNFNRIVADVMVLKLDAYAVAATITAIGQEVLVASDAEYITPDVSFLEEVFPELRDVQVKGVKWNTVDETFFIEQMHQYHYETLATQVNMIETDEILSNEPSAELTQAKEYAQEVMQMWVDGDTDLPSAVEIEESISYINTVILAEYETKFNSGVTTTDGEMNANQRIMLSHAVNNARAFMKTADDGSTEDFDALKIAVSEAENVLNAASATAQEAVDALNALNTEMAATDAWFSGYRNMNASSLIHVLPDGLNAGDIVYSVQHPGIELKLTGESGTTALGVTILTQDGVVINVSKEITIYDRADGVKLTQLGSDVESLMLTVGETADIVAALLYEVDGVNTGDKPLAEITAEEIKTVTWASTNMGTATVSGAETGTIAAVAAGTTEITVSVVTKAGNAYAITLPVIVTE